MSILDKSHLPCSVRRLYFVASNPASKERKSGYYDGGTIIDATNWLTIYKISFLQYIKRK